MSSYDALAAGYDALMTDVGYKKRADWLVRQFRKSGVPVRQVLDLGDYSVADITVPEKE